ncbi:hypothetical protein MODO_2630 [Myroides odoratimimus]|nr:hypothetical protein MODO_2630 [Myroides odoratimimus]
MESMYFNTYMVQLKDVGSKLVYEANQNFNTYMVQLKVIQHCF